MSGSSSAKKRSARKGAAAAAAAAAAGRGAEATANKRANGSLEDGLRALNAKLISRLRASEEANHAAASARGVAQQSLAAAQRARKNAEAVVSQLADEKKGAEARLQSSAQTVRALEQERETLKRHVEELSARGEVEGEVVDGLKLQLKREVEEKERLQMRVQTLERLLLGGKLAAEQSVQLSSVSTDVSCARSCSSISDAMEDQSGAVVADAGGVDVERGGGVVVESGASQPHGNVLASVMDRVCNLLAAVWQRIVSALQHWKSGGGGRAETLPLLRA